MSDPHDHYYDDFDDDDDDFDDELAEAEMNCSMMPDGQCGQAGSEYCDWVCPIRREHDRETAEPTPELPRPASNSEAK